MWSADLRSSAGREPRLRGLLDPELQEPRLTRGRHMGNLTSDFPEGADDHGPVVRGRKHVAIAGTATLLCVPRVLHHLWL